jgi:UrcA family protein
MTTSLNRQSTSFATIIAAALATTFAVPALQAAEIGNVHAKTVSYADLDVNSTQGARVLYDRVRSAAAEVCAALEGRDLTNQVSWHKCYDAAVDDAIKTIHQPTLTALYSRGNRLVTSEHNG